MAGTGKMASSLPLGLLLLLQLLTIWTVHGQAIEMFCERALLQYKEVGLKTYNEALEECRSVTGSTVASKLSLTRGCMGKMIERIRDEQKLNDLPTAWVNCGKFEYGPTTCETSLASDGFSYRPSHSHSVICETKGGMFCEASKSFLFFPSIGQSNYTHGRQTCNKYQGASLAGNVQCMQMALAILGQYSQFWRKGSFWDYEAPVLFGNNDQLKTQEYRVLCEVQYLQCDPINSLIFLDTNGQNFQEALHTCNQHGMTLPRTYLVNCYRRLSNLLFGDQPAWVFVITNKLALATDGRQYDRITTRFRYTFCSKGHQVCARGSLHYIRDAFSERSGWLKVARTCRDLGMGFPPVTPESNRDCVIPFQRHIYSIYHQVFGGDSWTYKWTNKLGIWGQKIWWSNNYRNFYANHVSQNRHNPPEYIPGDYYKHEIKDWTDPHNLILCYSTGKQ